ncbi:phage Terminase [Nitrobacter hamburgensis X14]|uniref:Phage Terminase n=1 Tax=Nitrobacter hamburgensis (strain DSM 10229 / NCIMB 13809 / X14) TaxID=323097 RepID=Q1QRB8_NITHX|nr:terminase TerL endonuclease subunit [Nitrobacter hamburgensis]ABE61229.1 phage Terminase [Nitrobacter hamburgensis X14]
MTAKSTFPEWIYDGSEILDPFGYGERAVTFLRRLKHPKSTLPGKAFQLDPWQERIVRRIYGPRHDDGRRIVNTVVMLLPRGNRKTSLGAALALLHTIGPERMPGSEVIFSASDRKQSGIAFKEARGIVQADKRLVKATKVYDAFNSAKKIAYPKDSVELEIISADAPSSEGRTPAFVLADETHIWRGKDLWTVLTNGLDKIDNSLLVVTTTAGRGTDNIGYEIIDRARKIARGEIVDPTVLPVLFEAEPDCDYTSEEVWRRVNPGSPHGYPSIEGFRRHVKRAQDNPTERSSLKRYKLNIWEDSSSSPFVDMLVYDEGEGEIDVAALEGQPCWLGVDLSSSIDLSVVIACFRDGDDYVVQPHFFCPQDNLRQRQEATGAPYIEWARKGLITATPGNVIDFRVVEERIRELCQTYSVQEIACDPAMARNLLNNLLEDGLPAIEHRQGSLSMMPAIAELQRAIIGRKFKHGGHPVLRFCFANVEAETNAAGHIVRFTKQKKWLSIDGAQASAMSVNRASAGGSAATTSLYDDPEWETALQGFNA